LLNRKFGALNSTGFTRSTSSCGDIDVIAASFKVAMWASKANIRRSPCSSRLFGAGVCETCERLSRLRD
jgi:hypothetical protein